MPPTVVLVHGACHGAWCWHKVVAGLTDRGIPTVAVDLPGHGESREPLGDLAADAAALRATLDRLGPSVVCGHPYGGAGGTPGAAAAAPAPPPLAPTPAAPPPPASTPAPPPTPPPAA